MTVACWARLLVPGLLILAGCDRRDAAPSTAEMSRLPSPFVVEAAGADDEWRYRYPGLDGRLGTADDRQVAGDLHLPSETRVQLRLKSADAVYFFGIPQLGLKQVAIPDMDFTLELETGAVDRYALLGDQLCGSVHPRMRGNLVVESLPAFMAWLGEQRAADAVLASQDG
jgi:cytochrome c oxidase subunit 2